MSRESLIASQERQHFFPAEPNERSDAEVREAARHQILNVAL